MRRAAALAGVVLVLLSVVAVTSASANDQEATSLTISAETGVVSGEPVEVRVRLLDARDEPVAGALIRLFAIITFLGTDQEVLQDEARTGLSGEATLLFAPVEEGEITVRASFDGAAGYAPAEGATAFRVAEPVVAFRHEPPGLSGWFARSRWIVLPFFGIWIAYAVALSQVRKIRQYGPRMGGT